MLPIIKRRYLLPNGSIRLESLNDKQYLVSVYKEGKLIHAKVGAEKQATDYFEIITDTITIEVHKILDNQFGGETHEWV